MSPTAFALVILAGFIHAVWNIAAKKAGGDARFVFLSNIFVALIWAPLGLWMAWHEVPLWTWREWAFVVLSGVIHTVYYVTLLRGYRMADLTVVYPVARGTGPLLASVGAIILLGERISVVGVLGIVGVAVGVFLIAGGPRLLRSAQDPAQQERLFTGLRYGAITGVLIATYTVVDGYAVKMLLLTPILLDYMSNFVRLALLTPVVLRDRAAAVQAWATQWKYALLVGAVSPVSYVLVLYAAQQAPLSHVAPAREVSMLFAALIGGRLLAEGDTALRLIGALAIAGGVIALALG
jgi:drug/metabolite transporter (DMT)-like permease